MDANDFDSLARLIGSRRSRRVALGLATTGLLSIALPDAAAAKCSKNNPCAVCYRCRRGRCKQKPEGAFCAGGTCLNGFCQECATREECPTTSQGLHELCCSGTCCNAGGR